MMLVLQDSPVSKQSWPLDHDLFIRSAGDTIRRLRNHPCIALWCGGNEQTPAPDIDAALQRMLPRRPTCSSVCSQQCLASHPCGACSTCSAGHMGLSGHPQGCLDAGICVRITVVRVWRGPWHFLRRTLRLSEPSCLLQSQILPLRIQS